MLGFERAGIGDTAKEDIGAADPMALFDEALNQCLRFARALSPYDMIAGPNNPREIKIVRIELLRHVRMHHYQRRSRQTRINRCR